MARRSLTRRPLLGRAQSTTDPSPLMVFLLGSDEMFRCLLHSWVDLFSGVDARYSFFFFGTLSFSLFSVRQRRWTGDGSCPPTISPLSTFLSRSLRFHLFEHLHGSWQDLFSFAVLPINEDDAIPTQLGAFSPKYKGLFLHSGWYDAVSKWVTLVSWTCLSAA